MKRISVLVSDEAWEVLRNFQELNGIKTRDEAMTAFIMKNSPNAKPQREVKQ